MIYRILYHIELCIYKICINYWLYNTQIHPIPPKVWHTNRPFFSRNFHQPGSKSPAKLPRQRSEEVSRRNSYLQWLTFRSIAWGRLVGSVWSYIGGWVWLVGARGSFSIVYNFWRRSLKNFGWPEDISSKVSFEIRRSTWNFWFGGFWGVLKVPRMTTFKILFSFSRLGGNDPIWRALFL